MSRLKTILIILMALIIFSLLFLGVGIMETNNPAFCSQKCHVMQPYYDSWNSSTHRDVNCKECHYEPGAVGWLKGETKDMLRLYGNDVESYPKVLLAKVKDESCIKCHGKRIEYGKALTPSNFLWNINPCDFKIEGEAGITLMKWYLLPI